MKISSKYIINIEAGKELLLYSLTSLDWNVLVQRNISIEWIFQTEDK